MLPRTHIMVHHSRTRDGQTVSWGAIRRYHVGERGWNAIGYHYGVELVGDHHEVLIGRSELEPAAACPKEQMNARALHVCCVGDFDQAPPPQEMLQALVRLVILPAMVEYGIPAGRIIGHRDVHRAKTCPGTRFDLEVVRRMSQDSMGTLAGAEHWHQADGPARSPLAALRRESPTQPSQVALAATLGIPVPTLAQYEACDSVPSHDLVPAYARALDVPEREVLEAFALVAMDFHRQRLAEASARLSLLHTQKQTRGSRAA
jgi:hypothetical protein